MSNYNIRRYRNNYINRKDRSNIKIHGGLDPTNLLGFEEKSQYGVKNVTEWINLVSQFITILSLLGILSKKK